MSQRGVVFYQQDDVGREWVMNGFIPPLVMELNVDTLAWCGNPLPPSYPDKVRTYTMTNDRYLLKSCWLGPYVKMSRWLDKDSAPLVYGPIASRMESAGNMLKNIHSYFNTYDVLYAVDFRPSLSTDLTFVQVTKHTAATFKMETPTNLNDSDYQTESCVFAETDTNDMEFYNPVYDNGPSKFGVPGQTPETVTVNSRLLSDNFCAEDDTTLKDTLSRIPGEMNERIYRAYMKMQGDYVRMRSVYSKNGTVPANLPGVLQPQQAAQCAFYGGITNEEQQPQTTASHTENTTLFNSSNTGLHNSMTTEEQQAQITPSQTVNAGSLDSFNTEFDNSSPLGGRQLNIYQSTEFPNNEMLPGEI